MANKIHRVLPLAAMAAMASLPALLPAQERLDPNAIKFDLRDDGPVKLQPGSLDTGESRVSTRGGAMVIDLHFEAKLINVSKDHIRAVTLLLKSQEATPGGKTSKSLLSLDVEPGKDIRVRVDGRVMRPVQSPGGTLVHVSLDGVLFKNFEFYGPDTLNSHRQMLAWEMQSDRDRKYFKQVLQAHGADGLKQEMLDSLNRQTERPRLDVQFARGRSTTSAASSPDHIAQFTFLEMPDSPIKPISGTAEIARNEARSPEISIQNKSLKNVRYVEIAWVVKDKDGKEYSAGSVPVSERELFLPPGRDARLLQDASLRFSRSNGQPVEIQKMSGYVSEVEYADHNIWIPKRETLMNSKLLRIIPPSPEELRLSDLYRTKGIDALVAELNKF